MIIDKVIILLIISICIRIRIYSCINIVRIINIGIGGMMLPIVHAHIYKLFLIIIVGICTYHVVDIVTVMKLCMRVISFVADSDISWRISMSRDGCVEILSIFLILCVIYVDSCVYIWVRVRVSTCVKNINICGGIYSICLGF